MTKAAKKTDASPKTGEVISVDFGGGDHVAKLRTTAANLTAKAAQLLVEKKSNGVRDIVTLRDGAMRANPYLLNIMPGWNRRNLATAENREHILALASDMATIDAETGKPRGVQEPLAFIWNGKIDVTSGHCRYAAVMHAIEVLGAKIEDVPIVAEAKGISPLRLAINQYVRNTGKQFNPLEKGAYYLWLREEFKMSDADIKDQTGVSIPHIVGCIRAHETLSNNPALMAFIEDGSVAVTLAVEVVEGNEHDMDVVIPLLTGATALAKERGAKKTMMKHVMAFAAAHNAKHGFVVEEPEAPASAPASESRGLVVGGKASSKSGKASTPEPTAGKAGKAAASVSEKREEIAIVMASILDKNHAAVLKLLGGTASKEGKTLETFLTTFLQGK
jgi:hypothetical protein